MTASDRRVNWIEEAFLESASVDMPIHLGAILILDGTRLLDSDGRFPIEELRSVISNRIHLGERLHQIPKEMPLRLGGADVGRRRCSRHRSPSAALRASFSGYLGTASRARRGHSVPMLRSEPPHVGDPSDRRT